MDGDSSTASWVVRPDASDLGLAVGCPDIDAGEQEVREGRAGCIGRGFEIREGESSFSSRAQCMRWGPSSVR